MTTPNGAYATPDRGQNPDLAKGLEALGEAHDRNARADAYYEGSTEEVFASPRLRRALRSAGVEFDFNFAKTPVDALTDRLEIAAVKSPDAAADAALAELWDDNELDLEIPQIHRRAGQHGDAYVMVWPRDDEDATPVMGLDGIDAPPVRVGIYYNSSDSVRLFYDTENPLRKRYVVKRWRLDDQHWRLDLIYPDRIEKYVSTAGVASPGPGDYHPYLADSEVVLGDDGDPVEVPVWPVENPFGEIPVFHFRNDRPYGMPEHKGFYGPQNAINKLIVGHMSGIDYQSFPQRYAMMEMDADTTEPGDMTGDDFSFEVDDGGVPIRDEDDTSGFTSDPGSVWLMKGVRGVGQFETADPEVFLKPMERYLRFGAQICTTPLRMFDYENSQLPSGASQAQADGPFVKKVRNRQLAYGAAWQDVFSFALKLLGFSDPEVMISWAPPNVVDDLDGWRVIAAKLAAGVPFETAMREAGYLQDEIESWGPRPAPGVASAPPTVPDATTRRPGEAPPSRGNDAPPALG